MASAALPGWLSDVPGDLAALWEEAAMLQEDDGGKSYWTCCAAQREVAWGPGELPWWQDQHVVNRNRLPSHTPMRCYESVDQALERRLSDELPKSKWILPLTPAKWDFMLA